VLLNVADLYCGAGGFSTGAERTGAAKLRIGVNHWDVAIKTHSANFPDAIHVNSRVENAAPSEYDGKLHLLLGSPECIYHSNARGGKPMCDQGRAQARDLLPWMHHHKPEFVVVENVRELVRWGPLNKEGRPIKEQAGIYFDQWLMSLKEAGYNVEHRLLNAADYGAATSRLRLFVICRRGRKKSKIPWPEPTHSRTGAGGLPRWRSAHEIIDWSQPCPSIFTRARMLKAKTILRIAVGLRKFCGGLDPFMVSLRNNCDGVGLDSPCPTITAGGKHTGLAMPFISSLTHGNQGHSVRGPFPTMVTTPHHALVQPFQYTLIGNGSGRSRDINEPTPTIVAVRENHGVVVPYIVDTAHGGGLDKGTRSASTDDPLGAVTTKRGQAVVIPVIQQYYGTGHCDSIDEPLSTLTTKERHALVTFRPELPWSSHGCPGFGDIDFATEQAMASLLSAMRDLGVYDIGFRMFNNQELAAAQGFSPDYIFFGNKSEVTKQVGNSVSPNMAEALVKALVS